jgi:hypothetical protein
MELTVVELGVPNRETTGNIEQADRNERKFQSKVKEGRKI